MNNVAVVTDSTCFMPPEVMAQYGIQIVPLHVIIDGRTFVEGRDIQSPEVLEALVAGSDVSTSQPSPAEFEEIYRRSADQGASRIVSLHISAELSGTVDSARVAAHAVSDDDIVVQVVDTRTVGVGLGFAAMAAARTVGELGRKRHSGSRSGADLASAAYAGVQSATTGGTWFFAETLEYLRRGGRISAMQAKIGTALSIKPVLMVANGRIEAMDQVRTTAKAVQRLETAVVDAVGESDVDVAIMQAAGGERAQELADRLKHSLPNHPQARIYEVGPVLAAHTGPGFVGAAIGSTAAFA